MKKIKVKYELAKAAKVGDNCICPSCGAKFEKTNYQQAFCRNRGKTKCKDKYWNTVIPDKRNNTIRISPASATFLASRESRQPQRQRLHAADIFGVWHDDDWHEHDGGSGGI